jgi:hypothetical protein
MFRSTPLQVESVVNIAPGSGGAARSEVPRAQNTATAAIHATHVQLVDFILSFIFVFFLLFLVNPAGHSHGDPRRV